MGNRNNPLVTVLMPAYNAEKYIGEAIESILNQTFKDFEFIIINDCSTDKTRKIIESYAENDTRVRLINNPENLKIAKTLNKGIKLAKGKYIARMDADDWSHPERIEKQIDLMEKKPNIVLSSANMEICNEEMKKIRISSFPIKDHEIRDAILQYNPIVSPCMIWKKSDSLEIGGFSSSTISEDYMFIMDMSAKGELANIKESLLKYRVLKTSLMGTKMREAQLSTVQIAITGHLKYGYHITFKTKMIMIIRLFIAYFIPSGLWRNISNIFGK